MKKRTKTISSVLLCGALVMNTGISAFAAGTGSSNVTLQVETGDEPAIVSVKVPTEIPLKMDKEGAVTVHQDLEIANLSDTTDVDLTGLSVVGKNGWSIKDYAVDLASRPEGTKELSMSFRGDGTTDTGEVLLTPDAWTVAKDSALPLNIAAKLPKQGNDYVQKGDIAQVNYRFTVTDDAGGEEETPDESVISNNWSKDKVLKDSVTPVTFNYDSTDPDTFIQSVESSDPSVTVARGAETYSLGNPGSEVWNVTAAAKGSASVTATLNTGETTQFDVNVYELNLGGDGSNTVTVPEVPDKGAGDSLETGDITIDIPITGPDGDDTITVTPDIPDDTVLEEGENTIDVTTDIDGVTVHITIIINIKSENPSNGLSQSVEEAQAMGFTFSPYKEGLAITGFENKQFKSEVNVPEQIGDFTVLKIGDNVFKDQTNLKKVTLPNTVTEIGASAFENCTGLAATPLHEDLRIIGEKAFYNCSGLTEVTLYENVADIGASAFANSGADGATLNVMCTVPDNETKPIDSLFYNSKYATVNLGNKVSRISAYEFYQMKNLTHIDIPSSVTEVAKYAFAFTNIEEMVIPETVTKLGGSFLFGDPALKSIDVKGTDVDIERYAFSGCGNEDTVCYINVDVPASEYASGSYASIFTNADLGHVVIGEGVTSIGRQGFIGGGDIIEVTLPSTLKTIGDNAFTQTGITELHVPSSVTSIGLNAFNQYMTVYYSGSATGRPWGAAAVKNS